MEAANPHSYKHRFYMGSLGLRLVFKGTRRDANLLTCIISSPIEPIATSKTCKSRSDNPAPSLCR